MLYLCKEVACGIPFVKRNLVNYQTFDLIVKIEAGSYTNQFYAIRYRCGLLGFNRYIHTIGSHQKVRGGIVLSGRLLCYQLA